MRRRDHRTYRVWYVLIRARNRQIAFVTEETVPKIVVAIGSDIDDLCGGRLVDPLHRQQADGMICQVVQDRQPDIDQFPRVPKVAVRDAGLDSQNHPRATSRLGRTGTPGPGDEQGAQRGVRSWPTHSDTSLERVELLVVQRDDHRLIEALVLPAWLPVNGVVDPDPSQVIAARLVELKGQDQE